ncbi:condensin subunit ScpB [Alteribacillus persepolensis]|uniref:Segregation and condensation protein B n=1 Tax=Alteribacillus persepolensis TaxID=568899 RepID=A0A1G7ZMT6_9BACI|nr:SMC-Scp complex subunit ScpB [Alteribacillus persepolensis]SDH09876.1 condensin subunit ScpB [Alteribacillus persepolensis]
MKEQEAAIEGLLYVAGDQGITVKELANVLEVTEEEAMNALYRVQEKLHQCLDGLEIKQTGDTYQLVTVSDIASYIETYAHVPEKGKLSQAALETLAIIAYNQPITRIEIDDIRGVKSEKSVQTLMNKALITESGRAQSIGRPKLYQTTNRFLEHFGLSSLEELPELKENDSASTKEADLFFDRLT